MAGCVFFEAVAAADDDAFVEPVGLLNAANVAAMSDIFGATGSVGAGAGAGACGTRLEMNFRFLARICTALSTPLTFVEGPGPPTSPGVAISESLPAEKIECEGDVGLLPFDFEVASSSSANKASRLLRVVRSVPFVGCGAGSRGRAIRGVDDAARCTDQQWTFDCIALDLTHVWKS